MVTITYFHSEKIHILEFLEWLKNISINLEKHKEELYPNGVLEEMEKGTNKMSEFSDEHVAPLRRQAGISGINAESGEKFFQKLK